MTAFLLIAWVGLIVVSYVGIEMLLKKTENL